MGLANQFLGGGLNLNQNNQQNPQQNNVEGMDGDEEWEDVEVEVQVENVNLNPSNTTENQNQNPQGGTAMNLMNQMNSLNNNSTLSNIISENEWLDDGNSTYDIIGICLSQLKVMDLFSVLTGDITPQNSIQPQIRNKIDELLKKCDDE